MQNFLIQGNICKGRHSYCIHCDILFRFYVFFFLPSFSTLICVIHLVVGMVIIIVATPFQPGMFVEQEDIIYFCFP